ncbi:SUKH-4 family immunity protein [Actinorugispora endophytica]|uniref:Nucleic acid/nucleotide deaminase of polymorphic system toxin n=1 Tax=Actinorugispora endophytica TaxID=1605990 RepID=A0A4R6UWU5_9ACTN|nr:SUKH-4 family immunity protein [Actinorugispora endophytica]TDQ50746.1 nucleic acid/nucleotide deaminase of polymorphic system toxin [Actinorugispora endophytica]
MVTHEQAVAIADAWLNGSVPQERRREVRTHEFDLGWVVRAAPAPPGQDPVTGGRRPPADVGDACGVVDRGTGELSTWPPVPVEEVVRMYQEKHGGEPRYDPSLPPVTGPGNAVVFTYRDDRGEETYVNRLSEPGMPPPEVRVWTEFRWMGVRPEDVVGVHSDLYPEDLPGGYHGAFLRTTFPGAEISCSHDYGPTRAARARGVAALVDQAEEMRRLAGQPPRPRPNRVPLPSDPGTGRPMDDALLERTLSEAFAQVQRYDADALAGSALPEATRNTLALAGLPAVVPHFFAADTPASPPLGGLFPDAATHLRERGAAEVAESTWEPLAGYVRIGSDGGAAVAVRCAGPDGVGQVWAVNTRSGSGRYVNRSVSDFGRCLALLAGTLPRLRGQDPYTAGRLVAEFQDGLAAIDGSVFGGPENWWSVVVEQMWDGLI